MIKYHNRNYPNHIKLHMQEVAGHFDIKDIYARGKYCLHTEYSYGKRSFANSLLEKYKLLKAANIYGVPILWHNKEWAKEFAQYIIELTEDKASPTIIEVHSPYTDYLNGIDDFLDIYTIFEEEILKVFPRVKILIENRCGTLYKKSPFLISKADNIKALAEKIKTRNLKLRFALDIPQLFTAHDIRKSGKEELVNIINFLKGYEEFYESIHLWGKCETDKRKRDPHFGDLNDYFYNDENLKNNVLSALYNLLNDDKERYLLLEVNSNDNDIFSICSDLETNGFKFI